jgi:hypothetical protein
MSCGCNNNGWGGGCGCNTVQYAPPACNPNFPTYCTALGAGTIQRVVGEDSAYCKYTVPTFIPTSSNSKGSSILAYSGATNGIVAWADGSSSAPIFISNPDGTSYGQAIQTSSCVLQATTPTGQLVGFLPPSNSPYTTKTSFPIVTPSGTKTNWGTVEDIIPNQGLVYKTGDIDDGSLAANTVYQLTGNSGQYVSFDSVGNPIATTLSITQSYIAKSGNYNANPNESIAADTTSGGWTLTLPANPATGTVVTVADANASWATNNLTVAASGATIQGLVQTFIGNVSNWQVSFYYTGSTWTIIIT